MTKECDISGLDPAEVLLALYINAKNSSVTVLNIQDDPKRTSKVDPKSYVLKRMRQQNLPREAAEEAVAKGYVSSIDAVMILIRFTKPKDPTAPFIVDVTDYDNCYSRATPAYKGGPRILTAAEVIDALRSKLANKNEQKVPVNPHAFWLTNLPNHQPNSHDGDEDYPDVSDSCTLQ